METQIIELTKKLIQIPSCTHNQDACKEALELIQTYFDGIDTARIHTFEHKGVHSLIITNFDGKKADIVLNGHVDVVPAQEAEQYNAQIKGSIITGRGSGDMKNGVAILVHLMRKHLIDGNSKKIMLMLTSDEEIGGLNGVGHLTNQGRGGATVLIPDGGSTNEVVYAEKGVLSIDLYAQGHATHSSRPWLGENAILKAIQCYQKIKAALEETSLLTPKNNYRGTTVELTKISGGTAENMIPGRAKITLNIRFTQVYTLKKIVTVIQSIIDSHEGISFEKGIVGALLYTDPNHSVIKRYIKYASKHCSQPVSLVQEHGASDGRHFVKHGSVVILHRPTCHDIHGPNEYSEINGLMCVYNTLKAFIEHEER